MKTILVPLDFSHNSKNALNYATLLANQLKMKLALLHVFSPSMAEVINDSYKVVLNKSISGTPEEVKSELDTWNKQLIYKNKNLESDSIFTEGDLVDEINEILEEKDIDLIVMGTNGASGLKDIFIGSNTMKVIEKVSCPVIAVPADYKFKGIKKIIFATDYHASDISSIGFLVELAKKFDSELKVVHVENEDIKPRFEENLLDYFIEKVEKSVSYEKMNFHLLEGGNIKKSLNDFISMQNADLIAISSEERLLVGPLFNRGLTKKLAHHIQIPLLTFKAYDNTGSLF